MQNDPFKIADQNGHYTLERPVTEAEIIDMASFLAIKRLTGRDSLTSPDLVRQYLRARLLPLEHEIFAVIFLDNQHKVVQYEEVFRGTLDGASVYPREIAKLALKYNAAAVIFAHNHPSGLSTPSEADKKITNRLKETLDLLGIRALDHLVIGAESIYSFTENGLL